MRTAPLAKTVRQLEQQHSRHISRALSQKYIEVMPSRSLPLVKILGPKEKVRTLSLVTLGR